MKNKILSWLVMIALCIVLIPVGCILFLLNVVYKIMDHIIS